MTKYCNVKTTEKYAIEAFKQDGSIVFLQVVDIKRFRVEGISFNDMKEESSEESSGEQSSKEQSSKLSLGQSCEEQSYKEQIEYAIADTFVIDEDLVDIAIGDIYAFGVWDKVVEDCLIEAKVINQSPSLSAELTLIPYVSEVFDAPNKPVPAYNPKTTLRSDYAIEVVKEKQHDGENLNNGSTVQDDGGIYFDFGGYSVAGNRLINRGSLKSMGDGTFSGVRFEALDSGRNYVVGSSVSQIKLNVDTLLYKDSSINFWITGQSPNGTSPEGLSSEQSSESSSKDVAANGYIFSRVGINGVEKYQLYWDKGKLVLTIQSIKETIPIGSEASNKVLSEGSGEGLGEASGETSREAMITIVNDFSNAEVRVYVNAVLRGRHETIETNAVSEEGDNLIEEGGESSIISEGLISYQEANRDIPFYLFGNGQENSSFSGKARLFRIFGWSLSGQDVGELYENNRILLNTAAETRYLGEFSLPPENTNLYDVFKYAGETNSMFVNNKKYAIVPNGWQIWEE